MRFWLWLTTGMVTKQWVAIHRKHHRFTDQEGDPHSPLVYGIKRVFFKGAGLYHSASKDKEMVEQYGVGTPSDWIERNLYSLHSRLGILLMLIIDLLFFGPWGLIVWAVQMLWIPFWAAGVVNGIGHWWGYRNGETKDTSRNISPWGIIIGGEELHNNHHLAPASAKLSVKPWEFDLGWFYIRTLSLLGLAKVRTS
jgi:stearoyl-CoA desaturase (delta-9 desaturase)